MNLKRFFLLTIVFSVVACVWLAIPADAQYNRYGGSNQYGSGYNQYGSSGYGSSGYGSSGYGSSGYGSSRYGGSSGGYNQYGSSGYGNSGYGSSGMGGMGSRSGRSSRRSSGGYDQSNQYGGQQQYGSTSRSGRSSRNNNNANAGYGGQVPNTAASQTGVAGQTSPTGTATDRRGALGGKSAVRGALPGAAGASASTGGLQIQGAGAAQGANRPPAKNAASRKKEETKTKPMATMYMETPSQLAVVNQPKTISVILSNSNIEYDSISFALQYDPDDLLPVSGQDAAGQYIPADAIPIVTALSSVASSDTEEQDLESTYITKNPGKYEIMKNTIDRRTGVVMFSAKVMDGVSKEGGEVVRLNFIPLREAQTTVSFFFNDPDDLGTENEAALTALTLAKNDQLGTRFSPSDGVINLDLQIFESMEKARNRMVVKKAGESSLEEEEEGTTYETKISLVPRQSFVDVGSVIDVDVVISNPDKATYDTVNLLIAYNPRIFDAVDGDDFAPDINIADTEYKDRFPLDFPILNTIDSDKGIIDFRKKTMRKSIREEGVIATIKLRAIRPTTKTTFKIFMNETGEEPTTGIFYRNKDRLGDPLDSYDGVSTCSVGVRPTTAYLKQFRR